MENFEEWTLDPTSLFDVTGKVAIIAGASGAFGALAARVLGKAGCKLVLTAGRDRALGLLSDECRANGVDVVSLNLRPYAEQVCTDIVGHAVKNFDRVDILVVASGKNDVAKITDMDSARFLDVMNANVTQSWLMAQAVTKQMLKQNSGGKIVLMSSARGLLGHPAGYTAYCASKSAVDGITKALGCELGPSGITVNAIAPTVFRSPLTEWMFGDDEKARTTRAGFLARVPKGRLGASLRRRWHSVPITDMSANALASVKQRITDSLKGLGLPQDSVTRVYPVSTIEDAVAKAELVIEAAPEKLELKQRIFADIESSAAADAILASNTSVIPISKSWLMGSARSAHPARIGGILRSCAPRRSGSDDRNISCHCRCDDGVAHFARQSSCACEKGCAWFYRQPDAGCAVARGDIAGREWRLRCRDG